MGEAVICRWRHGALVVDVMPTDAAVLGFTNRWYAAALAHATWVPLGTRDIRLITAPYFLATKFEAFHGRGHGDVRGSHDLEDIVAVTSFNARNFCAVPVSARGCPLTY